MRVFKSTLLYFIQYRYLNNCFVHRFEQYKYIHSFLINCNNF